MRKENFSSIQKMSDHKKKRTNHGPRAVHMHYMDGTFYLGHVKFILGSFGVLEDFPKNDIFKTLCPQQSSAMKSFLSVIPKF